MSWTVLEIFNGDKKIIRIRPKLISEKKSNFKPPINGISYSGDFWKIFEKYLQHVIDFEKPFGHPFSNIIHSVIGAGKGSLKAFGLTLSVSIEDLLKTEFSQLFIKDEELKSNIKQIDEELKSNIDQAKEIIEKSILDGNFKLRCCKSFEAMLHPRAIDKLEELTKSNIIDDKLVKSWRKLRNKSVHPDSNNPIDHQNYLDLCYTVEVLFNQLVFLAIGYTGKYTDYSKYGWPIREFKTNLLGNHNEKIVVKPL
jgi:hypothetical protein